MAQYLLSVHTAEPQAPQAPPSPEDMQTAMTKIAALEDEMEARDTFVFGGRLHGPDAATVVRSRGEDVLMTDGPFVEAKEHVAGFYIIDADDLDDALAWARKVVDCIGQPIEVRPFAATGRVRA
jgi:hypothetical protein